MEPGRDLFDAFRPCYIRAFNDAKDIVDDKDGKVRLRVRVGVGVRVKVRVGVKVRTTWTAMTGKVLNESRVQCTGLCTN